MLQPVDPYFDSRREFFHSYFEKAEEYNKYGSSSDPKHWGKWLDYQNKISLTTEQTSRIKTFKRKLHLLVMSGVWCGDCARQGPMLHAISSAHPNIQLRFIDNKAHPDLLNELRINGAEKVPVVVGLSEDFLELARFGDRHLSVYRRKAAQDQESGAYCDPGIISGPDAELREELEEWVQFVERLQYMLLLSPMLKKRHDS